VRGFYIEGLVNKIVAYGGKQRMPIRECYSNKNPCKMVYMDYYFGVLFIIHTYSYELTYSLGAYQK